MSEEPFTVEVTVAAPVDAVWRALRDPEEIRRWHGWHYDGLDKEIEIIYAQDATESAEEHWLRLGSGDLFELTDLGGATRIRLTRAPKGANPEWDAYYDDVNEGWITFLQQLRFALEHHPGEERRTVFHSGAGDAFAITGLSALSADSGSYALEGLTGEIWYRSANQLGVTVREWGDGLLVAGRSSGAAMLVLTTYGLNDAALAEVEARWAGRLVSDQTGDGGEQEG
ncbi:SRPBCC family protein [Acrocarpospora catenulata]|uniref:SRPBCC family protein n=1 Tax=Acrocarpospora catenulata TaxID=2836182 RepID=UPI001BD944B6|nr:SRPBCC domain-containing protein [Acrocarpospora catenulata]